MSIHVIPLKNGLWRTVNVSDALDVVEGAVRLSPAMYARWEAAYAAWWERKGERLAISPEMWVD